jgi:FlaA1/EpsC-like NDP-sugar epimerase
VAANAYVGHKDINFSVVRYGNVAGSRGSVIPFFNDLITKGETELPITDFNMTRFWISLNGGVELVMKALQDAKGGETFISKIPSFNVVDLAKAMLPNCTTKEVGIREGEKLHEIMITTEDSLSTYEYEKHYIIYPQLFWWERSRVIPGGEKIPFGFAYSSDSNKEWLSVDDIKHRLKEVVFE